MRIWSGPGLWACGRAGRAQGKRRRGPMFTGSSHDSNNMCRWIGTGRRGEGVRGEEERARRTGALGGGPVGGGRWTCMIIKATEARATRVARIVLPVTRRRPDPPGVRDGYALWCVMRQRECPTARRGQSMPTTTAGTALDLFISAFKLLSTGASGCTFAVKVRRDRPLVPTICYSSGTK